MRSGSAAGAAGGLQRPVVREHRALEVPERRARLEPEAVKQSRPRGPIRLERLCLAAGSVEGKHVLRAQPLAERVLAHKRLQLRDERGVPAELQLRVDPQLKRREADLLEPRDCALRERLVRQVGKRRSAPQVERLA